jgi:c-di-AMP phosphodiesterase-like protein
MISSSFVIVKVKNEDFISGRSLGDVNVQVILESLGGGGHMTIAGARIKCSDINDVLEKLRTAIDNYIEEVAK